MNFGEKEYIYAKTYRATNVEFGQDIAFQKVVGDIKIIDNHLNLSAGVYVILFGIQVVTQELRNVSIGILAKNKYVPEFVVMGTSIPGGILNLAGNGILLLENDCDLRVKSMTKGKIDCYEMMLSICKI